MPNIFGGDQMHPSYSPRKLKENEVLVDNVLYTIKIDKKSIEIFCEKIDGESWAETEKTIKNKKVLEKIKLLKEQKIIN